MPRSSRTENFRGRGGRHSNFRGRGAPAVRSVREGPKPAGSNAFGLLADDATCPENDALKPQSRKQDPQSSRHPADLTVPNQVSKLVPCGDLVDSLPEIGSDSEESCDEEPGSPGCDSEESSDEEPGTPDSIRPDSAHKVLDKLLDPAAEACQGPACKVFAKSPQPNASTKQGQQNSQGTSKMPSHNPWVAHPSEPQDVKTWASLVKNREISNGAKLHHIPVKGNRVKVDAQLLDKVDEAWGLCLVGHFATRFPGRQALVKICESWNVPYKFFTHATGWIIFKFENEEHRDRILRGGPYSVYGRPLMLMKMPPCFEFDSNALRHIPVWIKLPGLPLDCWNPEVLSIIASVVGKPIVTDMLTHQKARISYARVLVQVDAAAELITSVEMELPEGRVRNQPIVYEFMPKFCESCELLGHSIRNCPANTPTHKYGPNRKPKVGRKNSEAATTPARAVGIDENLKPVQADKGKGIASTVDTVSSEPIHAKLKPAPAKQAKAKSNMQNAALASKLLKGARNGTRQEPSNCAPNSRKGQQTVQFSSSDFPPLAPLAEDKIPKKRIVPTLVSTLEPT